MPNTPDKNKVKPLKDFLPNDLKKRNNENKGDQQKRVLAWLRRGVK